jgi:hypothetical protein
MPRLWLAALGAAAVIACGDDDSSGGGPNDLFPDVAGVYTISGDFGGTPPGDSLVGGTVTIEQASLNASPLTGTANLTLTAQAGNLTISGVELQSASVTLSGVVVFTVERESDDLAWTFTGERAGDVLEGTHTLMLGSVTADGEWSGER